ncbi:MAG: hypothetical protein M0R17_02935 [Candidatus Omnitrophica bacterium]|jgi:hypothetical protein|nr:hypothetical protein [Candidatus Omnitrophota bacterium]
MINLRERAEPIEQLPDDVISYDGSYPNLCSGTLVLRINNIIYTFEAYSLSSGGYIDSDYNSHEGSWNISNYPSNFPENLKQRALELVNDNIRYGCCGGCI